MTSLESDSGLDPAPSAPAPGPLEGGAVRNTVLQLLSQISALVFTAALTIYLARALGPHGYGVYALALSISGLLVFPAGLGLPLAIGRFVADHRSSVAEVRAIFRQGMRLQVGAALVCGAALFAFAGPLARAYHSPHLGWPLRFAALAVVGQALFMFLSSVVASIRQSSVAVWINLAEGAVETPTAIALVALGSGAAGAMAGKVLGYLVAVAAGLALTLRLLGGRAGRGVGRSRVSMRRLLRYSGAMFVVDVTWSAIAQIDIVLLGAVSGTAAVGSFGAVMRIMAVLTYLGLATASGVAPRLSLAEGSPDVEGLQRAFRYLIVLQGVLIAPTLVWATPIVDLVIGARYPGAAPIMRVLSLYFFISAPAALITLSVTYLGEARRRVRLNLITLVGGVLVTWVLIRADGGLGAAIGDDVLEIFYVGAHLWLCSTLIPIDVRAMCVSLLRVSIAIVGAAAVLFAIGDGRLALWAWIAGIACAPVAYVGLLLVMRELRVDELRRGLDMARLRLAREPRA